MTTIPVSAELLATAASMLSNSCAYNPSGVDKVAEQLRNLLATPQVGFTSCVTCGNPTRFNKPYCEEHSYIMPGDAAASPQDSAGVVGEMRLSALVEGLVIPVVEPELPVGTKLYTTPQPAGPAVEVAGEREAVARAICEACEEVPDHKGDAQGNEYRWQDYLPVADAAILAWQRTQSAGVPEGDASSEAWLQEWARDKFTSTGRYKGSVYGNTDWALARALHSAMLAAAPQPAQQPRQSEGEGDE